MMYTLEDLKKIRITLNIPNKSDDEKDTEGPFNFNYEYSPNEKLIIHLHPEEGKKPLFGEDCANKVPTPVSRSPVRCSINKKEWMKDPKEIKKTIKDLEEILNDIVRESRERSVSLVGTERIIEKRKRKRTRSSSSTSSMSNDTVSDSSVSSSFSCNSKSPPRKRYRKNSNGRQRKYNDNDDDFDKYLRRIRSRSVSSKYRQRSYSKYSHEDLFKSRSRSKSRRSYRKSSHRTSSRNEADRNDNYDDQQWSQMMYDDLQARHARFHAVMYAFDIVLDILRRDDTYNSAYC